MTFLLKMGEKQARDRKPKNIFIKPAKAMLFFPGGKGVIISYWENEG